MIVFGCPTWITACQAWFADNVYETDEDTDVTFARAAGQSEDC